MSRSFTRTISLAVLLAVGLLTGCSHVESFNSGRGAWNAPEYVYQPPWITSKYNAAVEQMESGDADGAIAAFEEFVAEHPEYPGAYVNLAILYEEAGRRNDALVQLDNALAIEADYIYALNQKGLILRRQGDFEGARDAWLAATQSDPNYANAWYNLGVLYDLYLQDLPAALEAYSRYQTIVVSAGEGAEEDVKVAKWIKDLERRMGVAYTAPREEETL